MEQCQSSGITDTVSSFMHFANRNAYHKIKITPVQPSGSSAMVLTGAETTILNHCSFLNLTKLPLTKAAGLTGAASNLCGAECVSGDKTLEDIHD